MYAHVGAASGGARGFIDLLSSQNRYGYGPLHAAAYNGRKKVVKLILRLTKEHADVGGGSAVLDLLQLSTTNGNTALHLAARLGHSEVIALLLEELGELPAASAAMILDAKNNDTHTNETHTPLEVSRQNGHKDCESMLSAFRDGLRLASEANAK